MRSAYWSTSSSFFFELLLKILIINNIQMSRVVPFSNFEDEILSNARSCHLINKFVQPWRGGDKYDDYLVRSKETHKANKEGPQK